MSQAEIPSGFDGLGLNPVFLKILEQIKFTIPTPIQHQSIPVAIEGKDVMGIAQTGTGKTIAFSVPMLQRLMTDKGRGLVLVPTRELASQVDEMFRQIGSPLGAKTAVLIGGESMYHQIRSLRSHPHVLIATPGRLLDHIKQGHVRLDDIKVLVLDEADRMFDMGFSTQINDILRRVPKERQTMLFSATMPEKITQIAREYMRQPVRVEVAPAGTAAECVEQEVFIVPKNDKLRLLEQVLKEYHGTVLVFSRTKFGAKRIAAALRRIGQNSAEIHSNRSLSQRREALDGFKSGKYRILVATDIAARGIDVTNIELVINFDLPDDSEDYVHRIGRTGRAGHAGKAISFACPEQRHDIKAIERLIRVRLPIKSLPNLPAHTEMSNAEIQRPDRHEFQPRRPEYGKKRFHPNKAWGKRLAQKLNVKQTAGHQTSGQSTGESQTQSNYSYGRRKPFAQRRSRPHGFNK